MRKSGDIGIREDDHHRIEAISVTTSIRPPKKRFACMRRDTYPVNNESVVSHRRTTVICILSLLYEIENDCG